MPQASILDLERPPLGRPHLPWSRRAGVGATNSAAGAAPVAGPGAGPGRLYLIEHRGDELALSAAERAALAGANIIVYERSLAALIAAVLPLGGYAEPAPAAGPAFEGPMFERVLKFALDGWSVVQLIERRPGAERARWTRDATEQLANAGVSIDTPVRVLVESASGRPLSIETRLRSADAVIADRLHPNGVMPDGVMPDGVMPDGVMIVFGPIGPGPAPQLYAFAANGLAG
jgi:hypothetical protein